MACSYPLGLEQLVSACELKVKQRLQGCQGKKYVLTMVNGELIVEAKDEPAATHSGSGRDKMLSIDVYDTQDNLVFSARQAHTLRWIKIDVFVNGMLASVLRQKEGSILPVMHIHDQPSDAIVMRLKFYLFALEFKLLSMSKTQIGSISRIRDESSKKTPKSKDNLPYYVRFPGDLDVRHKAAVITMAIYSDHLEKK